MKNSLSRQRTSQQRTNNDIKQSSAGMDGQAITPPQNKTGLPDALKTGIEALSGMSLDDVRVHVNSSRPAQLNALAYAQGTDIHVAPGQEQHLPHEAWHVVQQAQGRVQPTMQMKGGLPVNDDNRLEHEADVMGSRAFQLKPVTSSILGSSVQIGQRQSAVDVVQLSGKGKKATPPTGKKKQETGLAKSVQHHNRPEYAAQNKLQSQIYMQQNKDSGGKTSRKEATRVAKDLLRKKGTGGK